MANVVANKGSFSLLTDVTQPCRPVRDEIFVTANFNWRKSNALFLLLSRRDNTLYLQCCLYETKQSTLFKPPAD